MIISFLIGLCFLVIAPTATGFAVLSLIQWLSGGFQPFEDAREFGMWATCWVIGFSLTAGVFLCWLYGRFVVPWVVSQVFS